MIQSKQALKDMMLCILLHRKIHRKLGRDTVEWIVFFLPHIFVTVVCIFLGIVIAVRVE